MCASWRESTKRQYRVYLNRWEKFARDKGINMYCAKVEYVLDFLRELFYGSHLSYSAVNTARSALASFMTLRDSVHTIGSHPLISRFMKGVFNLHPPVPRYRHIWDVKTVLDYLRRLSPAGRLSLKDLTQKLAMLVALVSAQRIQTFHLIHLDNITFAHESATVSICDLLKHSKPGRVGHSVQLKAYAKDKRLCVVRYLKKYIERTQSIRGTEKFLFLCHKKPYHRASKATIARWIRNILQVSGIDTRRFKSHSTRAAATSAAKRADVPIMDIMSQAGWSNESTFNRFYNKPVDQDGSRFSVAVLENDHH